MPFEFKEIGARVCQTIFFHTFSPSKTVRLTTTAGVSRVIIIDEGKRGKSSNTPRSILHASINDTKNHSNSCSRCIDDNNNSNDNNDNSRRNSSNGIVESFESNRSCSFHDKPAFVTWIGNFSLPNNI